MINILASILPSLFKLGDKLIEDKDQKAEFAFKTQEMAQQLALKMLDVKTYPWVDALVKLAYASEQIVKGLFRPLVSAAGLVFVAYCEISGITLSPAVETVLISLFPAWGVSRYKEKIGPSHIEN